MNVKANSLKKRLSSISENHDPIKECLRGGQIEREMRKRKEVLYEWQSVRKQH